MGSYSKKFRNNSNPHIGAARSQSGQNNNYGSKSPYSGPRKKPPWSGGSSYGPRPKGRNKGKRR